MAESLYQNLPLAPGIYIMKDAAGQVLYVGKAGSLRRRVSSYFLRPHDSRIQQLVREIARIDHQKTDTTIEALILEAKKIKELNPPYNVREKDDKSFLYVEITKERLPRVLLVRGKDAPHGERFGPFTSSTSIRTALAIIRRIFPWNTHPPAAGRDANMRMRANTTNRRQCFDYEIGLCPGTCTGLITRSDYLKQVRNIRLFLKGKKAAIIATLTKEMKAAAKTEKFETAERFRRQLFALQHIQDVALIRDEMKHETWSMEHGKRIEGYDISNISGTSAVGSMVVFVNGRPEKSSYRKFRIKTVRGSYDTAMLREVLARRFAHANDAAPDKARWPLPDLILVDGGLGQVNAGKNVLRQFKLDIPLLGVAKGPERKRNDLVGALPPGFSLEALIRVRDEAHRFAIGYHKKLRRRNFLAR